MKDTKKKVEVKSTGENIPHIGVNIRYFRKKMKEKKVCLIKPSLRQF